MHAQYIEEALYKYNKTNFISPPEIPTRHQKDYTLCLCDDTKIVRGACDVNSAVVAHEVHKMKNALVAQRIILHIQFLQLVF